MLLESKRRPTVSGEDIDQALAFIVLEDLADSGDWVLVRGRNRHTGKLGFVTGMLVTDGEGDLYVREMYNTLNGLRPVTVTVLTSFGNEL